MQTKTIPLIGGFIVGAQAWTFNGFSAFEAVEKTALAGGTAIEFFPGQRLRPDSNVGVGPQMTESDIQNLLAKCKEHGITPVNFGVTGVNRDTILFAKKMGIPCLTTETDEAGIAGLEGLVKEFDIKIALHNHPRQPRNPNYKIWDPKYVAKILEGRDKRLGACADTGHWPRSGIKGIDAVKVLKGRILSSHLKDTDKIGGGAGDVPYGTGANTIGLILAEYKRQGFSGNISVEYEAKWENNVPDVAACIGFIRGWGEAQKK